VKLSECSEGATVVVRRVTGEGAIRRRLLEMGVVGGARLTIVKYAPLRDPIELRLADAHISLRVAEASTVEVAEGASLAADGKAAA
jgi:ferrous iron transport protein B